MQGAGVSIIRFSAIVAFSALMGMDVKLRAESSENMAAACAIAEDEACFDEAGRVFLGQRQNHKAIEKLKAGLEKYPKSRELNLLLVKAYLADNNDFWAIKTLAGFLETFPDDCEASLWLVWIHIRQAAFDDAREQLASALCPEAGPEQARKALLLAMIEQHEGQAASARKILEEAKDAESAYPEDREAIGHLAGALNPGYASPFSGRLDLAAGWASNFLPGSPTDPANEGMEASSPAGQLGLWFRYALLTKGWLRPLLETEARILGYSTGKGRDMSYLQFSTRPGVVAGAAMPNLLLAYRFDALSLAGGDRYESGPLWFFSAQRIEFEINALRELTIFGGAGRRAFREMGRSRTEADVGFGTGFDVTRRLHLMGAMTGRRHAAERSAYNLTGATALVSAEYRLPAGWSLRSGAMGSMDFYPDSEGYFDPSAPSSERNDRLLKLSFSVWSSVFSGLKAGSTYEFSTRWSTAGLYDYQDHRILLKLAWSFTFDPWLPAGVTPEGHVALDYGLKMEDARERIQDMLRQDEAAQRGSSCVE